jgi:hypothetical protein
MSEPSSAAFNLMVSPDKSCHSATGWYDQALTELVLETLDFETKEGEKFWCIDGGVQKIARLMGDKMEGSVHFKTQVTAINANIGQRGPDRTKYAPLTLAYTKTDPISKQSTQGTRDYVAVFNSTPLGALQRMDLRDAGLL